MSLSTGIYLVPREASALVAARGARSYAAVAASAGCSASFVCELSTGVRSRVTAALAARIEDALGVPRGSLFTLAPDDAALLADYRPDSEVRRAS